MANKKTITNENIIQDLSNKSLTDLLELKEATNFLVEYYGNFAKANTGNYEFNSQELYVDAKNLSEKYAKAYNCIISEIENKINHELF